MCNIRPGPSRKRGRPTFDKYDMSARADPHYDWPEKRNLATEV